MKIHDRHQFHGAALNQIAEHPGFTAINVFRRGGEKCLSAYGVNDDIGIYLKYGTDTHGPYDEYTFTFAREHLAELDALHAKRERTFVALVCWKDREVCCLRIGQLRAMIAKRRKRLGCDEDTYTVYVRAPERAKFHAYVSPPGKKNRTLGAVRVARSAFPECLFARRLLALAA